MPDGPPTSPGQAGSPQANWPWPQQQASTNPTNANPGWAIPSLRAAEADQEQTVNAPVERPRTRAERSRHVAPSASAPIRPIPQLPDQESQVRDPSQKRLAVPGYEVIEKLAEGGMGAVFTAKQVSTGAIRVIKIIKYESYDPDALNRFRVEMEALGALKHPGVVQIHSSGIENSTPYIVLEFIEGVELNKAMREPWEVPKACEFLVDFLSTLQYVHEQGIIHRDIKPQNIFLCPDGRAKITDFGIARVFEGEGLTRTGDLVGTPAYMAPEQVLSQREKMGPNVDIWAAGMLLFQMLTGRLPYEKTDAVGIMSEIVMGTFADIKHVAPEIDPDLQDVVRKALTRDPLMRYQSAEAFAKDLQAYLDGQSPRAREERLARRSSLMTQLSVGIAVLTVAIVVMLWFFKQRAEARTRARATLTQMTELNAKNWQQFRSVLAQVAHQQGLAALPKGFFKSMEKDCQRVSKTLLSVKDSLQGQPELEQQLADVQTIIGHFHRCQQLVEKPENLKSNVKKLIARLSQAPSSNGQTQSPYLTHLFLLLAFENQSRGAEGKAQFLFTEAFKRSCWEAKDKVLTDAAGQQAFTRALLSLSQLPLGSKNTEQELGPSLFTLLHAHQAVTFEELFKKLKQFMDAQSPKQPSLRRRMAQRLLIMLGSRNLEAPDSVGSQTVHEAAMTRVLDQLDRWKIRAQFKTSGLNQRFRAVLKVLAERAQPVNRQAKQLQGQHSYLEALVRQYHNGRRESKNSPMNFRVQDLKNFEKSVTDFVETLAQATILAVDSDQKAELQKLVAPLYNYYGDLLLRWISPDLTRRLWSVTLRFESQRVKLEPIEWRLLQDQRLRLSLQEAASVSRQEQALKDRMVLVWERAKANLKAQTLSLRDREFRRRAILTLNVIAMDLIQLAYRLSDSALAMSTTKDWREFQYANGVVAKGQLIKFRRKYPVLVCNAVERAKRPGADLSEILFDFRAMIDDEEGKHAHARIGWIRILAIACRNPDNKAWIERELKGIKLADLEHSVDIYGTDGTSKEFYLQWLEGKLALAELAAYMGDKSVVKRLFEELRQITEGRVHPAVVDVIRRAQELKSKTLKSN